MKFKKVLAGVCAGAMVMGMSVMPVCADDSTATWNVAFNGFNTSWGGWSSVSGEAGVLELEATVQDIMDANGITDITEFGGYIFQVWNTELGDQIEYTLTVNGEVYKEGTHTVATGDDGNIDYSIVQAENITGFGWGAYEMKATDVLKATVALAQEETSEEPSEEDPVVDETIAVETTGAGQLRAENDVYRVNIYNSWTNDENDCIVDPAFTADAASVNVTFTVTGLTAAGKSGNIGINFANSAWDTQYWDLAADESGVFDVNALNITEDGTYTVSIGKADKSALGALAFMDLQTDIKVNADEKDLDITSGIVITIDEISIVKAEANEEPVEDPSEEEPSEEQPSEEQPSEADPSDNDVPSTPSNPDGDVAPVAGLAVVAVAALGAAVVCLKKKENA